MLKIFTLLANYFTYNIFQLEKGTKLASSFHFFIEDTTKIFALTALIIFAMGLFKRSLSKEKVRDYLEGKPKWFAYLLAVILGWITPFCSCSSIPLFIGFLEARITTGIAFSFLITSPLVNEVAFVIMGGLFGWKLAFLYAISGITLGVIGGLIIGALKMEKEIILENSEEKQSENYMPKTLHSKIKFALRIGKKTFKTDDDKDGDMYFYMLVQKEDKDETKRFYYAGFLKSQKKDRLQTEVYYDSGYSGNYIDENEEEDKLIKDVLDLVIHKNRRRLDDSGY